MSSLMHGGAIGRRGKVAQAAKLLASVVRSMPSDERWDYGGHTYDSWGLWAGGLRPVGSRGGDR